jgi:DNA-binding transcriptional LysR family regulator
MSCPLGLQAAIAAGLPGFLAAHPRLKLRCVVTNRRVDLIHERIDVAIRVRERLDTDAELQMKRIGVSKRILVASPILLAGMSEPSTPDELLRFPTLHQDPEGPSVWRLATERGDADTVAIEPALATGSLDILIASACQGIGIGFRRQIRRVPQHGRAVASGHLIKRVICDKSKWR